MALPENTRQRLRFALASATDGLLTEPIAYNVSWFNVPVTADAVLAPTPGAGAKRAAAFVDLHWTPEVL